MSHPPESRRQLMFFGFGEKGVRINRDDNGELWFVGKDVALALGYARDSNPTRLFRSVPEEWKGVKRFHTPGGGQDMLTLSEQGLYFFLGRSDKP